jgi:hypothetical protein
MTLLIIFMGPNLVCIAHGERERERVLIESVEMMRSL